MLKGSGGIRRRIYFRDKRAHQQLMDASSEAKHSLREFFLDRLVTAAPLHLIKIVAGERLQCKVPLTYENRAGDDSVDGLQERECAGLQLKTADVHIENVFFANVRITEADVTQLAVSKIRVGKC